MGVPQPGCRLEAACPIVCLQQPIRDTAPSLNLIEVKEDRISPNSTNFAVKYIKHPEVL